MITERTLRQWRKDALQTTETIESFDPALDVKVTKHITVINELSERILRLTQELLDQHLLRK